LLLDAHLVIQAARHADAGTGTTVRTGGGTAATAERCAEAGSQHSAERADVRILRLAGADGWTKGLQDTGS
jgi:hypothetical protein